MKQVGQALAGLAGRVDTPEPVVVLDTLRSNVSRMKEFATARGLDLRPHVKTHKCLEIGRLQADAGACGITAGTVHEAEVFAAAGFGDIFLAYPIWAAGSKPARIRHLAESIRLTVMKHAIPLMPDAGGSIVCISSRLGMVGKPEETMYSAAKGGLIALARGAAIELTDRNIRVNVVAPGLTATEIIESSFQRQPDPEAYRRMRESAIPMRRLATPQEIADAVLFMASPESS
jgi:NAD(P)-dependent dehydrogenase (short-subunit alcohol dehydrogenase family)